jgi:hypothetical protein
MKKLLFIVLIAFAVKLSYADQLAWITKEQADLTVAYFEDENIKQVVLWCACCDNDRKVKVKISKIFYRQTAEPDYYEVVIEGLTDRGTFVNNPVDLAYVHIKRDGKWRCLGKELEFKCDPCTKAFKL